MMIRGKDKPAVAVGLFNVSLACAILAFIGMLGFNLILASSQWMLVGTLLAVWAVYMEVSRQ